MLSKVLRARGLSLPIMAIWPAVFIVFVGIGCSSEAELRKALTVREAEIATLEDKVRTQQGTIAELQMRLKGAEEELSKLQDRPASSALSPGQWLATISNTDGQGVYVRAEASAQARRLGAWSEGTRVTVISGPQGPDGEPWYQAQDESGLRGWVRGAYLVSR